MYLIKIISRVIASYEAWLEKLGLILLQTNSEVVKVKWDTRESRDIFSIAIIINVPFQI